MRINFLYRTGLRVFLRKTQGIRNTLFVNSNQASLYRLSRSPDVTRTKNRGVNTGHQKGRVFEGFVSSQNVPWESMKPFHCPNGIPVKSNRISRLSFKQ